MFNFKSYIEKEINNGFYTDDQRTRIFKTLEEMNRFSNSRDGSTCVYGQNMFLDRDEVKFYAFMDHYVVIGSSSDYNTKIEVLKFSEIEWFEYLIDNETDNLILRIYFKNNKTITLNNNLDTDRAHSNKLKEDINKIVDHLLEMRA